MSDPRALRDGGQAAAKQTRAQKAGSASNKTDRADGLLSDPTMGNGASATQIVVDGETLDLSKVRVVLPELRHQLKVKDAELERFRIEVRELRTVLHEKDSELVKLKAEIDKLQSVLDATRPLHKNGEPDFLSTIHEDHAMEARVRGTYNQKKQGVSGESSGSAQGVKSTEITRFDKDFR